MLTLTLKLKQALTLTDSDEDADSALMKRAGKSRAPRRAPACGDELRRYVQARKQTHTPTEV